MNFKERLKELRKRRGLSQVALAKKLGLSKSTIGAYETGDIKPSIDALNLIADFFNVNLDYLNGSEPASLYYLDPEVAEMAKEISDRPDLKELYHVAIESSREDVEAITNILKRMSK